MTYPRFCGGMGSHDGPGASICLAANVHVPVQMRGMSSALSAASGACDHMRDWVHGTPPGTFVSMGVFSDGSYNAPQVSHGP